MNALTVLKEDHRSIKELFARIDERLQAVAAERARILGAILPVLSLQANLEEPRILQPLQAAGAIDGSTSADVIEAFGAIRQDWGEVEALFELYEAAERDAAAAVLPLVEALLVTLSLHAAMEQEAFYPALRRASAASALDAMEEHHLVALLVAELVELRPDSPHFEPKLRLLRRLVEAHIKGEERVLFRLARQSFDAEELEALGLAMLTVRGSWQAAAPDVFITFLPVDAAEAPSDQPWNG